LPDYLLHRSNINNKRLRKINFSGNTQFKACKANGTASEKWHDYHQKSRNASARDLPDSGWNHSPIPYHHPNNRDGNFGAGSGYFDSYWQINGRRQVKLLKG
jgi:hypothetical protein